MTIFVSDTFETMQTDAQYSCFVTPQKHRFPKGNTRFYLVLYEIHVYFGDTHLLGKIRQEPFFL